MEDTRGEKFVDEMKGGKDKNVQRAKSAGERRKNQSRAGDGVIISTLG